MRSDPIPGYADWPAFARTAPRLAPPDAAARALAEVLGVLRPSPPAVRELGGHRHDGLEFTRLGWSPGYGPETRGWLVRPAGADGRLPGVLALHAHGGRRWLGAETLLDLGPARDSDYARIRRRDGYEGRALANELARLGFAVLAHDAFSWGSRRFALPFDEPAGFDAASAAHENVIVKTAGVLGTSFAGAVVTDDLVALDVLAGSDGVDPARLAAIGFSGGGARAHYLGALDERMRAVVIVCMMSTFEALIPAYLETHTWMLHSPGLAPLVDWPEIGAVRAEGDAASARGILALYGESDPLFPFAGMRDAHRMLERIAPGYVGSFHETGHLFTARMQREAAGFLREAI